MARARNRARPICTAAHWVIWCRGQAGDAAYLQERLQQLAGGGIALSLVEPPDEAPRQPEAALAEALAAKNFTRRIRDFGG